MVTRSYERFQFFQHRRLRRLITPHQANRQLEKLKKIRSKNFESAENLGSNCLRQNSASHNAIPLLETKLIVLQIKKIKLAGKNSCTQMIFDPKNNMNTIYTLQKQ